MSMDNMNRTSLYEFHLSRGAKMVAFAGYAMPIQYELGVMKEHLHTRQSAGIFDVSHMGQIRLVPRSGDLDDASLALEACVPADVLSLPIGRQRYALFLSETGGILDDLMIAKYSDHLLLIVNAATKADDLAILQATVSKTCTIEHLDSRSLIAVQGPKSEDVLAAVVPTVRDMAFMDVGTGSFDGTELFISRSGYTGEDGFEVSVPDKVAVRFVEALLRSGNAALIGLGARDSLRLESGLCLYGTDIDPGTTPFSAALEWSIQKSRRKGGARPGGFPGASVVLDEIESRNVDERRVGIAPGGRAPVRNGSMLFANETDLDPIGRITSGTYGPSANKPVCMGYVTNAMSATGSRLFAEVRGARVPVVVSSLPFVPHRFKRS